MYVIYICIYIYLYIYIYKNGKNSIVLATTVRKLPLRLICLLKSGKFFNSEN